MPSSLKLSARFFIATALATSAALINPLGFANDHLAAPTTPAIAANKAAKTPITINTPAVNRTQILNSSKFKELRKTLLEVSVRQDLTVEGLNKAALDNIQKYIKQDRVETVLRSAIKNNLAKPAIYRLVDDEVSEEELKEAIDAGLAQPGLIAFVKAELAKPAKALSTKEQVDYALQAMFSSVSPHDSYMPPKQAASMLQSMKASFVGIGVRLDVSEGKLLVTDPITNGPASKAGIKAGDIIVGIDNIDLKNIEPQEAIENHLRGEDGSRALIKVLRNNAIHTFELTRAPIKQKSVDYKMLEGGIAHFHVKQFNSGIGKELRERIAEAKAEAKMDPVLAANGGLKGVILNFMSDGGGSLPEARQIADDFIDKDGFVVSTEGRDISKNEILRSTKGDILRGLPMVVLVNEGSASAAELVPNALQDHERAIIMGTPTFGKGTVQIMRPLPDGSAVKITIAQFIRPSGTSNQLVGTVPDILIDTKNPEYEALRKRIPTERNLPNALKNDHGQAEQAGRTKQVCAPANDHDHIVPEQARIKGVFNKDGKMDPYLACARDYLLKQADSRYVPAYTITKPHQAPATNATPRPNS